MSYAGQTHTVAVPVPVQVNNGCVVPLSREVIADAFDKTYKRSFGRLLPNGVRRIINLRSAVTGKRPKFDLRTLAPDASTKVVKPKAKRQVHFDTQWFDTAIYNRLELPAGLIVVGPAILEQPDTTVLIEPGLQGRIDEFGNTVIEALERSGGE